MSSALRTAVFALTLIPLSLARDCFLMNGVNVTDTHAPCTADLAPTEHSSCCSKKKDVCMSSGLCLSNTGLYWETGCTDATWTSDACPNLCPDRRGGWQGSATGDWTEGEEHDYWQVLACGPNRTCCRTREGTPNCCGFDGPYEVEFAIGTPVGFKTMVTPTDMGSATCSPAGEGQSEDDNVSSGENGVCRERSETTVGAAVGASLGAALVAALGGIWFLLYKQKKLAGELGQYKDHVAQGRMHGFAKVSSAFGPVYRGHGVVEMDTARQYELDTASSRA
ncbi:hypothetical protein BDV19DRAFT_389386 [Aspergillus venezuelensis]